MTTIPAATQGALYKETDIRFWAQTGYKVFRKLDPSSPADAAMMPVWNRIYEQVKSEFAKNGWATPTHASTGVIGALTNAARAQAQASAHVSAAVDATDPQTRDAHLIAAQAAHADAAAHAAQAAKAQPVSIDHEQAHAASRQARIATGQTSPIAPDLSAQGHLSDADRAKAKQAIEDILHARQVATQATTTVTQTQGQPPIEHTVPSRTGAQTTTGVTPGGEPAIDERGRVKQPSGSVPVAGSRWTTVAIVAGCLGAVVAGGQLAMSRRARRSRRKSKMLPVAYIGGR